MGRLQIVAVRRGLGLLASALIVSSCDDASKAAPRGAPRERSEVVAATGRPAEGKAASSSAPGTTPSLPRLPRKLCEGQLARPGRDLPRKPPSRKAAPGTRMPSSLVQTGKWTWVNLWAAWCAPCKEEVPRLRSFSARLEQEGKPFHLVFVSLDDDERQLEQFLASPSGDGIRATYWLREGRERDDWLSGIGLGAAPDLPVQLLVDPRGKLRCTVHGAVEDADFSEISAALSAP